MKKHIRICKLNPKSLKNQKLLGLGRFYSADNGDGHGATKLTTWKFDLNAMKRALVEMIIIDEYPFSIVERVSLTIDTWTSQQRISFMSLTAHYIDENWKLHTKILNFCPVDSHKGKDLGDLIKLCLMDWGIDLVYAMTIDNASANDGVVRVVRDAINKWGTSILGRDELYMRCAAHIINVVVQDGAKIMNTSINSVRAVVKFIRQSPQRILRFKEAVVIEKIDSNKLLSMETPTKWNSLH
ncbi:hypothetical protein SLEP1_g53875 [Rubroshorea leprosula]|uniref:Transposase n=1 Tax=Rubroshorea leprosula TaxID=152421 RepID=A0AAV5MDH8_9ROSI|nr:hypothetical protein SLEP1_g53875 [Rubroshorea leprosula]